MGMFLLTVFVYLAGWGVICLLDSIHDELVAIREVLTEPVATLNFGVPVESLGRES